MAYRGIDNLPKTYYCKDGLPRSIAVRDKFITQQEFEDAIEKVVSAPPPPRGFVNFKRVIGSNKGKFASVPPHLKHFAEAFLDRHLRRLKREGRVVTRFKYASLCGNAAWYARHFVTQKHSGFISNRGYRRGQWRRILEKRRQKELAGLMGTLPGTTNS